MNKNTIRTLTKHGLALARRAFQLNRDGEGCNTIGIYLGVHWKTADGLINAGREVAYIESGYTHCKPIVAFWPDPRTD